MASHNVHQNVETRLSQGFSNEQLIDALKDIFRHYGYDAVLATVAQKAEIARLLSGVARKDPPWGYLYVHNFLFNNIQAGEKFKAAIVGLAAMIDGAPREAVQGRPVQVTALGNLRPGTLVFGDSRKCAYAPCPVWFLPKNSRQKYHSYQCRADARKAHKKGDH